MRFENVNLTIDAVQNFFCESELRPLALIVFSRAQGPAHGLSLLQKLRPRNLSARIPNRRLFRKLTFRIDGTAHRAKPTNLRLQISANELERTDPSGF